MLIFPVTVSGMGYYTTAVVSGGGTELFQRIFTRNKCVIAQAAINSHKWSHLCPLYTSIITTALLTPVPFSSLLFLCASVFFSCNNVPELYQVRSCPW